MASAHRILDEIINVVKKGGYLEIPFEVLKNEVFVHTHVPNLTAKEQILLWAANKGIFFEYQQNPTGKSVLFYRRRPTTLKIRKLFEKKDRHGI